MSRLTRCFCVFLGALLPIWIASAPSANGAAPLRIALVPIANPERLIDGVRPAMKFLEKEMGRKIRYFITLNYSAAVEAMAEAFAVIEKSGLDVEAFHEMIIGTAFGCPLYEGYGRQLHQQAWDAAGFRLALGLKDVKLVGETAAECGARMRLGELLLNRFESAVANGLSDKDWTAIAEEIRADAGL